MQRRRRLLVTSGDEAVVAPVLECVGQLSERPLPRALRLPEPRQQRGRRAGRPPQRVHPGAGEPRPAGALPARPRARRLPGRLPVGHARLDADRPDRDGERELASAARRRRGGCGSTRSCARPTIRAASTSRSTAFPPGPVAASATWGRPATWRCPQGGTGSAKKAWTGPRWRTTTRRSPAETTVAEAPVRSAFRGPELIVDVAAGQEVVCTIVNTRRTGPPVPPNPTPPGPTPPPSPQPGTSDLAVQKFVSARVAALGDIVEWTVVVTNNGPQTATGVTITDDAAARATIVSLQVSQGTCSRTSCSLGTIPPGGSVRIVARTRTLRTGARLNVIVVRGQQPDSIPENNAASALIRVLSSFAPPLQQRCGRLSVDRRVARAGATVPVSASRPQRLRQAARRHPRECTRGRPVDVGENERERRRHVPAGAEQTRHRSVHGRGAHPHRRRGPALHRPDGCPRRDRRWSRTGRDQRDRLARQRCQSASRRRRAGGGARRPRSASGCSRATRPGRSAPAGSFRGCRRCRRPASR